LVNLDSLGAAWVCQAVTHPGCRRPAVASVTWVACRAT